MNKQFLLRVIKFVEGLSETTLSDYEKKKLVSFVKINYQFVKEKRDVLQVAELAIEFINQQNSDQKEYLSDLNTEDKKFIISNNLDLVSFLGLDTFDMFISEINPQAKRKHAYMCLDSRYARFNQACTKLTWDFANHLNVVNNSTNVTGPVRDILCIRMHSMVVRKFSSIPQRATILIEELSAQSFIMPGGRRFHFVGLLNDLQNPINFGNRNAFNTGVGVPDFTIFDKYELIAGYKFNEGYYRFNKPITTLNEITISIGNPDTLVILPKYEFLNVTITDIQVNFLDIELNEPHYYISPNSSYSFASGTWYSVFVDEFNSSDQTVNSYINSNEFTIIVILSPTKIRLIFNEAPAGFHDPFPPVLNSITPPPPLWSAKSVRFNSYRIIMNFELEYMSS